MSDQIPRRPVGDLEQAGIVWAVNRYLFHPRGYALVPVEGGLELHGDGSQPFAFPPEYDDEGHKAFEDFLRGAGSLVLATGPMVRDR